MNKQKDPNQLNQLSLSQLSLSQHAELNHQKIPVFRLPLAGVLSCRGLIGKPPLATKPPRPPFQGTEVSHARIWSPSLRVDVSEWLLSSKVAAEVRAARRPHPAGGQEECPGCEGIRGVHRLRAFRAQRHWSRCWANQNFSSDSGGQSS